MSEYEFHPDKLRTVAGVREYLQTTNQNYALVKFEWADPDTKTGTVQRDATPAEVVQALQQEADNIAWLTTKMVRAMRNEGATWASIGDVFGITRQAAQQRFGS